MLAAWSFWDHPIWTLIVLFCLIVALFDFVFGRSRR